MSASGEDERAQGAGPTEEELRAAYEAELKKIRVEHVLLEHVVTLINLGMRRTGLAPGTEEERDDDQVRIAIEAIRALMPLLERISPDHVGPIRDALSQLQLAFVKIGGSASPPSGAPPGGNNAPTAEPAQKPPGRPQEGQGPGPGEAGPAQRSGRLWVPGQR